MMFDLVYEMIQNKITVYSWTCKYEILKIKRTRSIMQSRENDKNAQTITF